MKRKINLTKDKKKKLIKIMRVKIEMKNKIKILLFNGEIEKKNQFNKRITKQSKE